VLRSAHSYTRSTRFRPLLAAGFLAAGFVAPAAVLSAQAGPGAPVAVASDRARLLQLEDDWAKALVKRDRGVFQRLLAPGFVYTEDDKLSTRDEVLRDIITAGDTVKSSHNEDMVTHFRGSTGVVTGLLVIEGRANGAGYVHRYRFTDTWVKNADGSWQIFAAEDYLIPAKKS